MKIKPILAVATILMAVGSVMPSQAADQANIKRLLQTGSCPKCDLRNADLERANLENANLEGANLRDAKLKGARLRGANLRNADLRETQFPDADLRGAILEGANLRRANLRYANLQQARTQDVKISEADLTGANVAGTTLANNPSNNNGRISLELYSRNNDDVRVIIEGGEDRREIRFGRGVNKEQVFLSPRVYKVRFQSGSGNTWKSGKLDLSRTGPTTRLYFNRSDRSVQLEGNSKAWNSD